MDDKTSADGTNCGEPWIILYKRQIEIQLFKQPRVYLIIVMKSVFWFCFEKNVLMRHKYKKCFLESEKRLLVESTFEKMFCVEST